MVTGTATGGLEWLEAGQASPISWGFGILPSGLRVGQSGLLHSMVASEQSDCFCGGCDVVCKAETVFPLMTYVTSHRDSLHCILLVEPVTEACTVSKRKKLRLSMEAVPTLFHKKNVEGGGLCCLWKVQSATVVQYSALRPRKGGRGVL